MAPGYGLAQYLPGGVPRQVRHLEEGQAQEFQRESLTKPDMQKNTDYAPSSGRDPEHTTSVNLSVDQSTHAAKKVLRMVKYKGKTSSDSDTH